MTHSAGPYFQRERTAIELIKSLLPVLLLSLGLPGWSQSKHYQALRRSVIRNVDNRSASLKEIADQVWSYAEPPLAEVRSADLLKKVLRENGFVIKDSLCGFGTVFMATYGTEGPVIGLFGEYDSDANASNEVVPYREAVNTTGYGHGGHHNLLGVGSLGAALAIRDQIRDGRMKCTIRYYGTSDEGGVGTKSYLAGGGYFDKLDISLYWHPAPVTAASTSPWDARYRIQVRFAGSAGSKEESSSNQVLDATENFVNVLVGLRRGMSPLKRLLYEIRMSERELPRDTVVFDITVQTAKQEDADELLSALRESVVKVSAAAAVPGELCVVDAKHQFLPNVAAMRAVYSNMQAMGSEQYSDAEQQFVKELQRSLGEKATGISYRLQPFADRSTPEALLGFASDIGDASWIAPEIYFVVETLPAVPMHQWPGTIFSAHSIGHRGMLRAAKILAMTIVDFAENETLRKDIRAEFDARTGGYRYQFLKSCDTP